VREGETLLSARRNEHWQISTAQSKESARILVAADGRNSTVARLCHLMPSKGPDRVALQTHVPLPDGFGDRVVLQLLREGYSGQAPVGDGLLNLCLVSRPNDLATIKRWAEREFSIPTDHPWRTIAPLARTALPASQPGLYLVGTRRGLLSHLPEREFTTPCARASWPQKPSCRTRATATERRTGSFMPAGFGSTGSPTAVLHPRLTSNLLGVVPNQQWMLRKLTKKVVRL
jgi:2-polyprenyl-6-methoxyphenol hydroxylase-like FAD-dependent oxidoreductase